MVNTEGLKRMFKKNDLVYIPLLGAEIYTIEEVVDDRIVVNGKFVEFYTNFHVYEEYRDNEPVKGNFNYRTGYISGEGRVVIGEDMPIPKLNGKGEVIEESPLVKDIYYIGNVSSKFIYEATFKNHGLLELLTGDKYERLYTCNELAIELLKENDSIIAQVSDDTWKIVVIERYDENNKLFYDAEDNDYNVVIPIDVTGKPVQKIKK